MTTHGDRHEHRPAVKGLKHVAPTVGTRNDRSMTTFATSPMASLIDVAVRYDLGESTCPAVRLADLVDPAALKDLELGYGTTRGDAELRALIAADAGVTSDDVLVTVGAVEAMFLLAQDRTGGRAVVVGPCFPPAQIVPAGLGTPVEVVPAHFDDGYRLPIERIERALTADTRLVSLASPQNPSGVRFTDTEIRDLVTIVEQRSPDAVVFVDETYRASTYGNAVVPRSMAALSSRVVTCSSLSKAHGAPGLRLGWLTATDQALYERLRNAKMLATIACSTLDETLATAVLHQSATILAPRATRLDRALSELMSWATDQPIEVVRPDGGAICCVRLRHDIYDDATIPTFYRHLSDQDVRVAPGSWFGADDRVFRIGFGHLAPADLTEALDRLAVALVKTAQ
jgi:aspartate/methionine/tyrosine aminotransferase